MPHVWGMFAVMVKRAWGSSLCSEPIHTAGAMGHTMQEPWATQRRSHGAHYRRGYLAVELDFLVGNRHPVFVISRDNQI